MGEPALGMSRSQTDQGLEGTGSNWLRADIHLAAQLRILLGDEVFSFIGQLRLKTILGVDDELLDKLHSVQLLFLSIRTYACLLPDQWILLLEDRRLRDILSMSR